MIRNSMFVILEILLSFRLVVVWFVRFVRIVRVGGGRIIDGTMVISAMNVLIGAKVGEVNNGENNDR